MKRKAAQAAAHRKKKVVKIEPIGLDGLTDKQRAFIEHYLTCWNATAAAKQAGYSIRTAQEQSSRLLSNVIIRQAIDARLKELCLGADEVLARLSALAAADMDDFLSPSGRGVRLDLKRARTLGKLHLVKKFSKTKQGTSIELHDAKDALIQVGRYHGLFTDKFIGEIETLTPEQLEQRRKERWEKAAPLLGALLSKKQDETTHE